MDSTGIEAESVKPQSISSLAKEIDEDLLCLMCWTDDSPEDAKTAFEEFYNRHVGFLYAVCYKTYRDRLCADYSVMDLVVDTFARAKERGDTYKSGGIKDPDDLRRRTEGWLLVIARSVVADLYRGQCPAETQLPDEGWQCLAYAEGQADSPYIQLVRRAYAEVLDERELEVILVTFHWYDPDRENQKLPDKVTAELAAYLGTTTDNLRKIRAKAIRKVKEYILQHRHELPS